MHGSDDPIPKRGEEMKSYALAIALAMLVAAVYAFQNTGEVLVRFLIWELSFPQGIWEVMLFAAGGVLMWLVSLFASMESRSKYLRQVKEKEARIKDLENEKSTLVEALRFSGERHEAEARVQRPGEVVEEPKVEALGHDIEQHEGEQEAGFPGETPTKARRNRKRRKDSDQEIPLRLELQEVDNDARSPRRGYHAH